MKAAGVGQPGKLTYGRPLAVPLAVQTGGAPVLTQECAICELQR